MKIAIVEDNFEKARLIYDFVAANINIQEEDIHCCVSVFDARKLLAAQKCDILILDLVLPTKTGLPPVADGGMLLLNEIFAGDRLFQPTEIICCSEFADAIEKYKDELQSRLVHLIQYEESGQRWKTQLGSRIRYIAESLRSTNNGPIEYDYDVAIVTSSPRVEMEAVLSGENFREIRCESDSAIYYEMEWAAVGKLLRVVACAAPEMGMLSAALSTSKLLVRYRPRHCFMAGIAAGVRGDGSHGDLLMAESAFDYGSGKISRKKNVATFEPDPRVINIDQQMMAEIQAIERDQCFVAKLWEKWPGEKPKALSKCVRGPFASGAAVVQDINLIDSVVGRNRKLIGLDMEVYGFFHACHSASLPRPRFLAVKGISDFADKRKNDRFQKFAAYMSAGFIKQIVHERIQSWQT